jgi:hypothetical protein
MFIFTTDQELWTHELMSRIMGQKDIRKFVYCFMILFLKILGHRK